MLFSKRSVNLLLHPFHFLISSSYAAGNAVNLRFNTKPFHMVMVLSPSKDYGIFFFLISSPRPGLPNSYWSTLTS